MRKAEIEALLKRVRGLKGPDREVDAIIETQLAFPYLWTRDQEGYWQVNRHGTVLNPVWVVASPIDFAPRYTASLDAIVGLVKRELPGWTYRVAECSVSDDAWVVPDFNHPERGARFLTELADPCGGDPAEYWLARTDIDRRPAGNPALALCEAFLSALATKLAIMEHSDVR